MYEYGKNLSHSTYECLCVAHETTISHMKEIAEIFNSEINEIHSTNRDIQNYIDSCHKYSEIRAEYPEQSTAHFENVVNITVLSDSVIPHKKKMGVRNIIW